MFLDTTSSAQLSQSSEKLSLVSVKNKLNPAWMAQWSSADNFSLSQICFSRVGVGLGPVQVLISLSSKF